MHVDKREEIMKKYYEPEKVKTLVPIEPIPDEVRMQYLRPGELLHILDTFPVAYQRSVMYVIPVAGAAADAWGKRFQAAAPAQTGHRHPAAGVLPAAAFCIPVWMAPICAAWLIPPAAHSETPNQLHDC